jgi:hypothetical protein
MKITRSIPLVQYLYRVGIAFLIDGENVIIDDLDYAKLLKSLKQHQRTRFKIKDNPVPAVMIDDGDKVKKKPKHVVYIKEIPKVKKVIPDEPKKIVRPPAVYTNPDYKNMYL